MNAGEPDRRSTYLWIALPPFLLSMLLFAGTIHSNLVYDDPFTLSNAEHLELDWKAILTSPRSLTYLVHKLDQRIWSTWIPGYHLSNVLLHGVASGLAACAALIITKSRMKGLLCGLFFCAHPVHVEVVASITNRKDALAMAFAMLAIIVWRGARSEKLRVGGSTGLFLAGVYCKEVAVAALPVMLLLSDILLAPKGSRSFPGRLVLLLPIFLISAVAAYLLAGDPMPRLEGGAIERVTEGKLHDYEGVLATSAGTVPRYAGLLLWPVSLSIDYPVEWIESLTDAAAVGGALLLVAWLAAAGLLVRRSPVAAFAMTWVVVMFLPCAHIIPLNSIFVADRYLYVPSFGVCLLLAHVAGSAYSARAKSRAIFLAGNALVLATLVFWSQLSLARGRDWKSNRSLVDSSVREGLDTCRIHVFAGLDGLAERDYEQAARHFRRAVEMEPLWTMPRYNLGLALQRQGDGQGAAAAFRSVVALHPGHGGAYRELGKILLGSGEVEAAVAALKQATRILPDDPEARRMLDLALQRGPR